MDNNQKKKISDMFLSDKSEYENSAEYELSDYMPSVQRIVKTDAKIRISDKNLNSNGVDITGEVVYTVIYISDPGGILTSVIFREDFEKHIDFESAELSQASDMNLRIACLPQSYSSKMINNRKIAARSKFTIVCEIVDLNYCDCFEELPDTDDCETEYLSRNIVKSDIKYFDNIQASLSEEITVDEGMPEIVNIISANSDVCIKSISCSNNSADITGEISFTCLYEARSGNETEYVSMYKVLPFRTETELADIDASWNLMAEAELTSLSADAVTDNYGENKNIDVSFGVCINVIAIKNATNTVVTDMYSTKCDLAPKRMVVRNYSLAGKYEDLICYEERIRFDLRGINDIVSSDLSINFGNPELSEGKVVIPCKGILSVMGTKENGTIESQTSQITLKIVSTGIPAELFLNKNKWINTCSVCRYECEPVKGELLLRLWVNQNFAALKEENIDIICGYEKNERESINNSCGFTLYYPSDGESVWNVAKDHHVSLQRMIAENGIEGEAFDGKRAVILH